MKNRFSELTPIQLKMEMMATGGQGMPELDRLLSAGNVEAARDFLYRREEEIREYVGAVNNPKK
jgi:hypothetical protein